MHGLHPFLLSAVLGCFTVLLPGSNLTAQDDAVVVAPQEAPQDDGSETRIVRLQHVSAQELESTLRQFLQEDEQQRRRVASGPGTGSSERGVTTRSHAATNSLILSGAPRRLDEVMKLIASLDIETATGSARLDAPGVPLFADDEGTLPDDATDVIRVLRLEHLHAGNAVQNLRTLLGQNELRAVSLDGQSSVALRGSTERVRLAVRILEESDRAAGPREAAVGGPAYEVFRVQHRDAQELQDRIRLLFPAPANDSGGLRLCAFADRIVARGTTADLVQVRGLIEQLDAPTERDR